MANITVNLPAGAEKNELITVDADDLYQVFQNIKDLANGCYAYLFMPLDGRFIPKRFVAIFLDGNILYEYDVTLKGGEHIDVGMAIAGG